MNVSSGSDLNILYLDNHLIAAHKPSGMLTQSDESGEDSLMDRVKTWIKTEYEKPGNVFLGLVHRLDRPVSGVVLFARTSKAALTCPPKDSPVLKLGFSSDLWLGR